MRLTGIAKPRPAFWPLFVAIATFMPITRPLVSRSGPPELPGLRAASVWIIDCISWPSTRLGRVRLRFEMMPVVIVPFEAEGIAEGVDALADLEVLGRAEGDWVERVGGGVDLEDRHVVLGVEADEGGVVRLIAGQRDLDLPGHLRRRGSW